VFSKELAESKPKEGERQWLFVPYDQLSDKIGPLAKENPSSLGIVLVETPWKPSRRPYHKQKLALILSNIRHFALEQAKRGVAVRHVVTTGPYRDALSPLVQELGGLIALTPAERELRMDLQPLVDSGSLQWLPHEGWLTTREQFEAASAKSPLWLMDRFYRRIRKDTGILMVEGRPVGGKWSLDAENRLPWSGDPPAPDPPTFPMDPIKKEVGRLVEEKFGYHPGRLHLERIPSTQADARKLWSWAKRQCLEKFGPFEDAMSTLSRGIFHTRISALLHIHRLLPKQVLDDVAAMNIPLSSKEGFIRQVLGWREFMNHIHQKTDGFRLLPDGKPSVARVPGDGSFGRWRGKKWTTQGAPKEIDGGAVPSFLGCRGPLPPAYWGETSGLSCLDTVVADVWEEGYGHHITRLMILANVGTLLDVSPRELTDWFWVSYTDAYDWVVEPNVLGMGTYAVGDLMTTKPYVSGTPYIHKMSDYCRQCSFDPKKDCPISNLYWAFLERHRNALKDNSRMKLVMASAAKRSKSKKQRDRAVFQKVSSILSVGDKLTPSALQ
jgi:deoxyribodipyrimidine photolyase-related protein